MKKKKKNERREKAHKLWLASRNENHNKVIYLKGQFVIFDEQTVNSITQAEKSFILIQHKLESKDYDWKKKEIWWKNCLSKQSLNWQIK